MPRDIRRNDQHALLIAQDKLRIFHELVDALGPAPASTTAAPSVLDSGADAELAGLNQIQREIVLQERARAQLAEKAALDRAAREFDCLLLLSEDSAAD